MSRTFSRESGSDSSPGLFGMRKGIFMTLQDYMKLPYTRIVKEINDESGHYFHGRILELDGCQSTGDTAEELHEALTEALEGNLEVRLEKGLPIPKPVDVEDYSGKFVVRVPKSLHMRLAEEAKREGVSLNQYALYKLAN